MVRAQAAMLAENPFVSQATYNISQLPMSPDPGDLTASSGLHGHLHSIAQNHLETHMHKHMFICVICFLNQE